MAKVCFGMIMSLDGFVNDRNGGMDKLYASFEPNKEINDMMARTGSVILGRRTFDLGEPDAYADNYEFQVPIFVMTHHPPVTHPKENGQLKFTFVSDGIESAVQQAKAAAGEKDVLILGADVFRQALKAGLVEELQIAIAPILLGKGLRLFEQLEELEINLEKIRTIETRQQVEIWYKVIQ